jgi:Major Facilitator Superfamily
MSCFAYVADQTPPQRRMIRILVVEMCMLVGGIVSPIGVGPVIDRIGSAYTILVVVCSSVVNFIYVFICLPGSNTKKISAEIASGNGQEDGCTGSSLNGRHVADEEGSLKDASEDDDDVACLVTASGHQSNELIINMSSDATNDIPAPIFLNQPRCDSTRSDRSSCISDVRSDIIRSWTTLVGHGPRRWRVLVLLGAFFITSLPAFNFSVGTLFEMNHPLCWTINMVGVFSGLSLGVSTAGALIVAPLMKRCMSDIAIATLAGLSSVATNVYKAFVQNSWMMFICEYSNTVFFF